MNRLAPLLLLSVACGGSHAPPAPPPIVPPPAPPPVTSGQLDGVAIDQAGRAIEGAKVAYARSGTILTGDAVTITRATSDRWCVDRPQPCRPAPPGYFSRPGAEDFGPYVLRVELADGRSAMSGVLDFGPGWRSTFVRFVVAEVPAPPTPAIDHARLRRHFAPGTHLWALSYYGAMSAPIDRVERDARWVAEHGIENVRIWPDFTKDIGEEFRVWDRNGNARPGRLEALKARVAAFARRGISVDLTLYTSAYNCGQPGRESECASDGEGYDVTPWRRVVERILREWRGDPSVRLVDVANEGEARGPGGSGNPKYGHVSAGRFHELMLSFANVNPDVLLSYSVSGDLEASILPEYAETFSRGRPFPQVIRPHAARPASPGRIDGEVSARLIHEYPGVPVYNDEPGRRYYLGQMPRAADFIAGATSSCESGAVGWCFHNGESFDLRTGDLSQRIDGEERAVMAWLKTHRCANRGVVPR